MQLWVNILVEFTFWDYSAVGITAPFSLSINQAFRVGFLTLNISFSSALWQ